MKNLFSKIVAASLFLISIPFLLMIGLLITLFERDTVIFKQQRLGLNKNLFTIYKLRTMKNGQITFIGSILRKTGIDELPQLINIILGDLAFIGPRPLTQFDVDRLEWNGSFHRSRWKVKPGITGLSQLSPICHKKMTLFWDKYYAQHKTLLLDFKIISGSILSLIIGKNKVKSIINKKLKK
jgi:lipopolysaccharide/colanic/teichoic acid biosynthesis glycosyltransferase